MIKLIIFDIDGVITDGSIIVGENGSEQKKLNLKDIDAIFELKSRGFKLAAITGEKTPIVSYFEKRFPWDYFFFGEKNKIEIINEIQNTEKITLNEICYIGDGKYDVEPLKHVGLGICPSDAIDRAKDAAEVILQNNGGQGCLWELLAILDYYNGVNNSCNYFYRRLSEHTDIFKRMASDVYMINNVISIGDDLIKLFTKKGQFFLCGNGGSAAEAQHIATEFVSRFYKERNPLNAEALTVNTSILTAISNDYNYEKIFVRQLEAKAKPGDMLLAMSTSGKSKNVLEALRYSKQHDIRTVLLMGDHESSELNSIADYIIKVPSKITPRIQEAHLFIGHLIAEYVEDKIFN